MSHLKTISEVSKELEISERMLRHYEERGLVHPKRGTNNYRHYSESDLEIVQEIKGYQQLGFSLLQIETLLKNTSNLKEALTNLKSKKLQDLKLEERRIEKISEYLISKRETPLHLSKEEKREVLNFNTVVIPDWVIEGAPPEKLQLFQKDFLENLEAQFKTNVSIFSCDLIKAELFFRDLDDCYLDLFSLSSHYSFGELIPSESLQLFLKKESRSELHVNFSRALASSEIEKNSSYLQTGISSVISKSFYSAHEIVVVTSFSFSLENEVQHLKVLFPLTLFKGDMKSSPYHDLSKKLSHHIKAKSNKEIIESIRKIDEENFLMTLALVDNDAKTKLLALLSDKAQELVLGDSKELTKNFLKFWG